MFDMVDSSLVPADAREGLVKLAQLDLCLGRRKLFSNHS